MNKPQTFPDYLPAVNRRLEYQAGLFTPGAPLVWDKPQFRRASERQKEPQWVGEDFSHVIVSR